MAPSPNTTSSSRRLSIRPCPLRPAHTAAARKNGSENAMRSAISVMGSRA